MVDSVGLELRGVSVRRGRRSVLEEISLDAPGGEVLAVLGPNGAGKSTLLRAVSGLVDYHGEVLLAGRDLQGFTPRERAKLLSFVPQQSLLAAAMRVSDVVAQGRYAHAGDLGLGPRSGFDRAAIDAAMEEADVAELRERLFSELSFGEQKRVLIARALSTGARVLLLDEPTASLDIAHALRLGLLLRELAAQGRCIVVVLHQLDEALKLSDRAALLKAGRLLAHGPSHTIIDAERVRTLYGVELVPEGGLGFRLPAHAP